MNKLATNKFATQGCSRQLASRDSERASSSFASQERKEGPLSGQLKGMTGESS
jgi:hypothetical protein